MEVRLGRKPKLTLISLFNRRCSTMLCNWCRKYLQFGDLTVLPQKYSDVFSFKHACMESCSRVALPLHNQWWNVVGEESEGDWGNVAALPLYFYSTPHLFHRLDLIEYFTWFQLCVCHLSFPLELLRGIRTGFFSSHFSHNYKHLVGFNTFWINKHFETMHAARYFHWHSRDEICHQNSSASGQQRMFPKSSTW